LFKLNPILLSGKEVLPIIEGGKGIGITNGTTAGSFAAAGGIGTFSGVLPESRDEFGRLVPIVYHGTTRIERHQELIEQSIRGGISQAKIARDIAGNNGRIHINVLWEMGGAEEILEGVLSGARGLVHGITCGAGMPYKVAEIAEKYNVHYYPIVSSMRAFRALWKRAYHKRPDLLGAVVYEDPWLAGGHNGLSNSEDPEVLQDPYPRIVEIRQYMNEVGLQNTPIVMAGGVWHLRDWANWLDNPELGPIAFQFGTRPIMTVESPVSSEWKKKLLTLKEKDVFLNKFSPTGFYSSAINNSFIKELRGRNDRQVEYKTHRDEIFVADLPVGQRGRPVYLKPEDKEKAEKWIAEGYIEPMKTPDETLIFVDKAKGHQIHLDQVNCMGCLSACRFSNWSQDPETKNNTGRRADPRSFCIQKTLSSACYGVDIENQLMFSGHNAFKFATDPFYKDGFIPTTKQLVERICEGN
jgi:nitronate monooxygenase